MSEKHKKKLLKLLYSLIVMVIVTTVGYYNSYSKEDTRGQIIANPRLARSITNTTRFT